MITEMVLENKSEYKTGPPDYDGLWKKVIGDLFEEFMLCFAPDLYKAIDFSKSPDFLEQELHKIIIKERKGRNVADQIVKVSLKSGEEKWILIHIEVQAKSSVDFTKRMFRYFYRIYDKFDQEVYAIALITDDKKSKHPDHFHYSFHGTKVVYTYNVYKFHEHKIAGLEQSPNPFAAAVIAGKYVAEYKGDPKRRSQFKLELMKQIISRFSSKQDKSDLYISALIYFVDYLIQIPEDLESELKNDIAKFINMEGGQQMQAEKTESSPALDAIFGELKRMAAKKGMEEGMEKGIKKGLKKGKEEGKKEGFNEAMKTFARKLIKQNYPNDKVSELTGLEHEEVKAIRKSLQK